MEDQKKEPETWEDNITFVIEGKRLFLSRDILFLLDRSVVVPGGYSWADRKSHLLCHSHQTESSENFPRSSFPPQYL